MASNILASVTGSGTESKKIQDLHNDTKDYHDSKNRITSDWCVKSATSPDRTYNC